MTSILPEELHDEIPSGFNIAGHVGKTPLPSSVVVRRRPLTKLSTPQLAR